MVSPEALFKASAIINAILIIDYIGMGFQIVNPAISTISSTQHHAGQRAAENAWNFTNGSFLITGIAIFLQLLSA
jgi:hypothetical protein